MPEIPNWHIFYNRQQYDTDTGLYFKMNGENVTVKCFLIYFIDVAIDPSDILNKDWSFS